ncbi:MAG: hypothetical protein QXL57_08625, partial [Candidatus Bathyarchaeia archaeon]
MVPVQQKKRCPLKVKKTRLESIVEFGERGKRLQEQRSLEYWKALEAMLPAAVNEKILRTTVFLQQKVDRGKLKEKVAIGYRKALLRTAVLVHGDLDNVQAVAREFAKPDFKGQLRNFIAAYNYYREANNIKEKL